MPERWLVIAHEATNSGAPRMLLRILHAVRARRGNDWSCDILLGRGGPLESEFARLGSVCRLSHPWAEGRSACARVFARCIDRPWLQPRRLAAAMQRWAGASFDLVYNNTFANGRVLPAARALRCPILTHVHELGYSMRRFNTPARLAATLSNTDHFIGVSRPVAEDLAQLGVTLDRITVVPNFLPELPAEPSPAQRQNLRSQLGVPPGACVVTGCGHVDWVKGTDLFVEVADVLAQRIQQPVCFFWLGDVTDASFARRVRRFVRRRNLEPVVRFVGPVEDATPWYAASDVVVVPSRFESFSLVTLEAAALARPVVGFAGARGLNSVLGETPELLAPEHSAGAMASLVRALLSNPDQARRLGQRLRIRVAAEFLAAPGIAAIVSVAEKLQRARMA